MDFWSVRSHSQPQRKFYELDGFTSQCLNDGFTSQCLNVSALMFVSSSVLGVFESMTDWLFNCFILYDAEPTHAKKLSWVEVHVEVMQSREITGGGDCPVCPFLVAALLYQINKSFVNFFFIIEKCICGRIKCLRGPDEICSRVGCERGP